MRVEGDGTLLAHSEAAAPSFVASEEGKLFAALDPISYITALGHPPVWGQLSNQTADGTLVPAPPAGQKFYLVAIKFSAFNTSSSANGVVQIRDGNGGTPMVPYLMGQAGLGSVAASQSISEASLSFLGCPLPFTSAIFVDIITGTITYSAFAIGYYK